MSDEELLKKEILNYEESMKTFLPMLEQAKKLRREGKNIEEIINTLGVNIFEYVPDILYHGSPESLDVINAQESTQKGSYVYATDNPVHAIFFSIFRNSSIVRAHIDEYVSSNGNYKVKYTIDERVMDSLNELITDREITVHVCDGSQFFKPQGSAFIGREWVSKEGQNIVPTAKIKVNIKRFLEDLESQGLLEYDRYNKSKDWKTVIDMLGLNYPFGLATSRGENIEEYDNMFDEFIGKYFNEQLEFSKAFRTFVKEVMNRDYRQENPQMSLDEEYNFKLNLIEKTADSFLIEQKDENGKINYGADYEKIEAFINEMKNTDGKII